MSYVYINEDGVTLNSKGGYFIAKYNNGIERKIPKETIEGLCLFGNVSLTNEVIKECLKKGIRVSFFSKTGSYFGRLESTEFRNIKRFKEQVKCSENNDFRVEFARRTLSAKINNQCVVLKRYNRTYRVNIDEELKNIKYSLNKCCVESDISSIMGYEGLAAKNYFKALGKMVKPDFSFKDRNRMPPRDPFNSMISLGYTILMYEIYGELENKGLSPYCGFVHSDSMGHPTLASDLMEEWRAVIIDSMVFSLIQGNEIAKENFYTGDNEGVFIDKEGMKIFLNKLDKKFKTETGYINSTYKSNYRKALGSQVVSLVKAIEEGDASLYSPICIK